MEEMGNIDDHIRRRSVARDHSDSIHNFGDPSQIEPGTSEDPSLILVSETQIEKLGEGEEERKYQEVC